MSIRRDYRPPSSWQSRRKSVRRHGLLVITLVLIGLFGGLLAYIKGDRQRQAPVAATTPAVPAVAPGPKVAPAPPKVVEPEPVPAPIKPKYDFYTELPKRQVDIVPEDPNSPQNPRQPAPRTQPAHEPLRKPAIPQKHTARPSVAMTAAGPPSRAPAGRE